MQTFKSESLTDMIQTHGIILGTERYGACLAFYRDTLELPVWYEREGLCCLHFGGGYLMIETRGQSRDPRAPGTWHPAMLRFYVKNVWAAADLLESRGIAVARKTFGWGIVGTFLDPDGNICELKDADDLFFLHPGHRVAAS